MKRCVSLLMLLALMLLLCSCRSTRTTAVPDTRQAGIDWEAITARLTPERLAACGWYNETLLSEAQELGCMILSNYDPAVAEGFRNCAYQFTPKFRVKT